MTTHELLTTTSIDKIKDIASQSSKVEVFKLVRALLYDDRESFRELGVYLYVTYL